jgi:hypothetical protein
MGQEASFQQQGKITFAREKAQKGTEKKAMRNDHKQAEINRDGRVDTEPHEFAPLRRWRNRGRCRVCKVHEANHPVWFWAPSRPLRDRSEAYVLD